MIKDFKSVETRPFFRHLSALVSRLSPNTITVMGFGFTLIAAGLLLKEQYALAALFTLAHLLCDGLDGHIARKYNKGTELGFLLDHILDRLSDLLLFPLLGLVTGEFVMGVLVAILCLFSSYVGILNRVVGGAQDKGGPFAKSYRYQLLILVLVACEFAPSYAPEISFYFALTSLLIGGVTIGGRLSSLFNTVIKRGIKP